MIHVQMDILFLKVNTHSIDAHGCSCRDDAVKLRARSPTNVSREAFGMCRVWYATHRRVVRLGSVAAVDLKGEAYLTTQLIQLEHEVHVHVVTSTRRCVVVKLGPLEVLYGAPSTLHCRHLGLCHHALRLGIVLECDLEGLLRCRVQDHNALGVEEAGLDY